MEFSHIIAHSVIFIAYLVAVFRVPPSFAALIQLRLPTIVAGAGFFLFCGLTHLGLSLNKEDALLFYITDHLQAVSIVAFLVLLSQDISRALSRLRLAFKVIRQAYGADGEKMIATVTAALQGRGRYGKHK